MTSPLFDAVLNLIAMESGKDGPDFYAYAPPPAPKAAKSDAEVRKGQPVATGVLAYFPDAIRALAELSRAGNDKHNPGQPLHWAREKSTDQLDAAVRHIMDHMEGRFIDHELRTFALASAAWRLLAELQLFIERERAK